jgi:TolA-binding protein
MFFRLSRVLLGVIFCFALNVALFADDNSEISVNTLKKLTRDKDKSVAYTATAQLAAYYRREGDLKKAEKVLKDFSSPSGFDRLPAKVAIPYLRCLLENAHIKALKKDLPGSLQLLNWAERRKRDYERAFSCLKYAEILLDLNETERAQAYLKNVKQILAKHINEAEASGGAIGQGSKTLDTQSSWRTLRDQADHLALEIEEVQLSKKFGATYASYVKLRRLQKIVKRSKAPRYFNEAIKLCDDIAETDPQSQFAAAAGYLKGQLLLNNPAEDQKRAIKDAKDHLEKFIKADPEGLYRGEALMLLGKTSLEKEWDAKDAEKYYSQALAWFKRAREKRNALSLYAPMSNDLKNQTKATQRPTTLNKWKRTVYHKEDPLKLYNTASSPPWYVSDKEKNCYFVLGLLNFANNKYDKAKEFWSKIKNLDENIANMDSRLPNVSTRLLAACNVKHMMFTAQEKKNIKNSTLRLKVQFAEYLFLQEKFEMAKERFEELLKTASKDDSRAIFQIGIADCIELKAQKGFKEKSAKIYEKIVKNKKLMKSDIYALAMYRYSMSLFGTVAGQKKAYEYCLQYAKRFPEGRNIREANFYVIRYLILNKENIKAKKKLRNFSKIYDGYAMYLKDLLKQQTK